VRGALYARCYCAYMVERLHDFVVVAVELRAVDVFRHLVHPLWVPIGQVPLVCKSYHTLEKEQGVSRGGVTLILT
jgi:hypothetical protein